MDSKKKTITFEDFFKKYLNEVIWDGGQTDFIDCYCLKVNKHLNKDWKTIQQGFAEYLDWPFSIAYDRTINDYADALQSPPKWAIVFREDKVAICKKAIPWQSYVKCYIQLKKWVEIENIYYDNILWRLVYHW